MRSNYLSRADVEAVGGKVSADEEFRHVKGETGIWISNYARVLSKRRGKPRILKTVFQRGYHRLTLPQYMHGKKIKTMYYVHVLVAQAFCDIPSWIYPGERVEIHHKNSVNRECDIAGINNATNLMYVPRRLHKAIDSIAEISVNHKNSWRKMNFIQAAAYYGISPYEFLGSFANEREKRPDKTYGKYQYYSPTIKTEDEREVKIEVRIVRIREEKGK